MEFVLTLVVAFLCVFGNPTDQAKSTAAGLWLATLFAHYVLEPHQMAKYLTLARYFALSLLNVILTYGIFFPLTFLVVPFTKPDGTLPRWLLYFATFDASMDSGWKDGYFPVAGTPTGLALYWLRCRWLFRNTAYGLDYYLLGITYSPDDWTITELAISNGAVQKLVAWTKDYKHFCYTSSNGVKLGWKLWWALDTTTGHLIPLDRYTQHDPLPAYPQNKRLMFVFTP